MKLDNIDITAIAGSALLTVGVGLIYIPAAFIVAGVILISVAIIGAKGA